MAALPVNVAVQPNQQMGVQNPAQGQQNAPMVELDPVSKVKQLLLPRLKESLVSIAFPRHVKDVRVLLVREIHVPGIHYKFAYEASVYNSSSSLPKFSRHGNRIAYWLFLAFIIALLILKETDKALWASCSMMNRIQFYLQSLMKVAAQILGQNSQADDGHKSQEGLQQMYEKSLEDFYSICDQIEVNLRLALEMQCQQIDSGRYTPLPVTVPKSDANLSDHQSVPYPQFLVTVKHQISCTKDMFDLLTEFIKKLGEKQ